MHKIKTVVAMLLASSFLVAGVASAADVAAPAAAPAKHKVIKKHAVKKHMVKKHYVKHVKHMKKAPAKKAAPAM